jgi:hypothetical protein
MAQSGLHIGAAAAVSTQLRTASIAPRAEPATQGLTSAGSLTGGTTKVRHIAPAALVEVRFAFGNYYNNGGVETDGVNDITVRASIEYPAATFIAGLLPGQARRGDQRRRNRLVGLGSDHDPRRDAVLVAHVRASSATTRCASRSPATTARALRGCDSVRGRDRQDDDRHALGRRLRLRPVRDAGAVPVVRFASHRRDRRQPDHRQRRHGHAERLVRSRVRRRRVCEPRRVAVREGAAVRCESRRACAARRCSTARTSRSATTASTTSPRAARRRSSRPT